MRFACFTIALGIAVTGLAPRAAFAAIPTASFGVTAMVQASCLVFGSVLFKRYAAAGVNATTAVSVSVTCSHSTPYSVSLSGRLATVSARKMTGGQMASIDTVDGIGNSSIQALAVHEQVSAELHYVATGEFADAITVTVIY